MEIWRRRILLICVSIGICLAMYASYAPTISVTAVDFTSRQANEFGFGDEVKYLKQLPLDSYIEEKIRDRHAIVTGDQWSAFFKKAIEISRGELIPKDWEYRITRDDLKSSYRPCRLYFKPNEFPLEDLVDEFTRNRDEPYYLILEDNGQRQFLEVTYHTYSSDDLTFGSGLIDAPPARFHFPLRRIGYILMACGGVAYVVLPRKKRAPEVICFAHWTMIFGDVVSLLLFVPFFFLPMFICGGVVEAVTHGWFMALVLWPMAMMGAWLLMVMAIYASYEIHIEEEGLEIFTGHRRTSYRFEQMSDLQPLSVRFPAWLTMLLSIAALASHGANQFRLAGQALIVGSSASDGIRIGLKDGNAVYLWISNQMGNKVLKNAQLLATNLEQKGIELLKEVKVVNAILMPEAEDAQGKPASSTRDSLFMGLIVFPLLAMGVMLAGWWLVGLGESVRTLSEDDQSWREELAVDEQAEFPAEDVTWERRYRSGISPNLQSLYEDLGPVEAGEESEEYDSYAGGFLQLREGGFLIYGNAGPASYIDGYLVRTDGQGQKLWETYLGADGKRQDDLDGAMEDRDGGLLVWGATRQGPLFMDGSRALISLLSSAGKIIWETSWGEAKASPRFCTATQSGNGSYTLYGVSGNESDTFCVKLEVDPKGSIVTEEQWDVALECGEVDLHWIAPTQDGGCVITGEINVEKQFTNLLLLKLDAKGRKVSQHDFGGPKLESGRRVIELADGGCLAAGIIDNFSGQVALYLVKLDAEGKLVWEQQLDQAAEYIIHDLRESPKGNFLLAGDFRSRENSPSKLWVAEINIDGNLHWEQSLTQDNVRYSGQGLLQAADGEYFALGTRSFGNQDANAISLIKIVRSSSE